MVIDCHVHLCPPGSDPDEYFWATAKFAATSTSTETAPARNNREKIQEMHDAIISLMSDANGKKLLRAMRQASIERSILLPLDIWPMVPGSEARPGALGIKEKNLLYHELAKEHPDTISMMVGIDPRRDGALDFFNHVMGMDPSPVGLKLHPAAAGFYPDEPACYPFYKACMDWGVPVLFHAGGDPAPFKAKYAHPLYIDTVAADFPDLDVVIAHCGGNLWRDAIEVAAFKPNVYVDFSNWQMAFKANQDYFWEPLRRAIDAIGPWRVMFGTDSPFSSAIIPTNAWIEQIRQRRSPRGFSFNDREIEIFLGEAAKHLFQL
nr:amidohydrolase family protein [Candidatus Sigynarchaeota archaeon]